MEVSVQIRPADQRPCTCQECGKEYHQEPGKKNVKFCTERCYRKHHNRRLYRKNTDGIIEAGRVKSRGELEAQLDHKNKKGVLSEEELKTQISKFSKEAYFGFKAFEADINAGTLKVGSAEYEQRKKAVITARRKHDRLLWQYTTLKPSGLP